MEQTNDVGIHEDDNIMKFQASIPSIVNTLKKIYISQKVYHWFRSYFFDEKYNELCKEQFNIFI